MKSINRELRAWVKALDVPDPPQWGVIETSIPATTMPKSERGILLAPQSPALRAAERSGIWGLILGFVIPLAALGCIWGGVAASSPQEQAGWFTAAQIAFIVTLAVPVTIVASTSVTTIRAPGQSGVIAWSLVCSLTAVVLLIASVFPLSAWIGSSSTAVWTPWIVAIAAIVSAVCLGIVLFARSPQLDLPRANLETLTLDEKWRMGVRAIVLEELLHRGKVAKKGVDPVGMNEMPLGTWHLLDQPRQR